MIISEQLIIPSKIQEPSPSKLRDNHKVWLKRYLKFCLKPIWVPAGAKLGWKSVPIPGFAESKLCLHNLLAGRCPSLSCLTCIVDLIESVAEMDWFLGYILCDIPCHCGWNCGVGRVLPSLASSEVECIVNWYVGYHTCKITLPVISLTVPVTLTILVM